MNKFMTKIVGICLGLTMAVGVGVAAGNNNTQKVDASSTSYSVVVDKNISGYANWGTTSYGSGALRSGTVGDFEFHGHYLTRNANPGTTIQAQKSNATLYNVTPLGARITSIVLSQTELIPKTCT